MTGQLLLVLLVLSIFLLPANLLDRLPPTGLTIGIDSRAVLYTPLHMWIMVMYSPIGTCVCMCMCMHAVLEAPALLLSLWMLTSRS